jgi:hypothetical protein
MGILLHSNGHLQDSTVALIIDVHNMWEVSMEGPHNPILIFFLEMSAVFPVS